MKKTLISVETALLLLILVVAAALRFWHYDDFSYTNDELSALLRLNYDSFDDLLEFGIRPDGHPALTQVVLWYLQKAAGWSEAVLRLPFVLAGVGSVWLTYLIGKRWFSPTTGLLAAAVIAFSCFTVLYSQVARPYALGLFFVLLTAHWWSKLLIDYQAIASRRRWFIAIGMGLAAAAGMYTHYFAGLSIIIIGVSGLFFMVKENRLFYLAALGLALLTFLPHLGISTDQLAVGGVGGPDGWLPKPDINFLPTFIAHVFNDSQWLLTLCGLLGVYLIISAKKASTQTRKMRWLALSWWGLPLFIGFTYSYLRNPVLQPSVLLFSLPFLILLMFSGAGTQSIRVLRASVIVLLLGGSFFTVFVNQFHPGQHFGSFKGLIHSVDHWYPRGNANQQATVVMNVNHPFYVEFYNHQIEHPNRAVAKLAMTRVERDSLASFARVVKQSYEAQRPEFVYGWSTKHSPAEVDAIIREYYPEVINDSLFFNARVTRYGKQGGSRIKPLRELVVSLDNQFDADVIINEEDTYGANLTWNGSALEGLAGKQILVNFLARCPNQSPDQSALVAQYMRGDSTLGYSAIKLNVFLTKPRETRNIWLNLDLPESIKADDVLKVYLWNQDHLKYEVEWIEVRVLDNTPQPSRHREF